MCGPIKMKQFLKLKVPTTELKLDTVLFIGQVFRWKRHNTSFYGVIGENILEMSQNEDEISVRCLNKEVKDLEKIIQEYFILDVSLKELHEKFSEVDPLFKKIAPHFTGMRVIRQEPFECLMSFICSSNNNVLRITKMIDALCVKFGSRLGEFEKMEFYSFPTIDQLKRASEEDLRDLGFGYRAKFILKTVEQLLALDRSYLMDLRKKKDVISDLTQFHGVGIKIAACVALYSLEKFDYVPMDVHMLRAVRLHYLDHPKITFSTSGLEKGNLTDVKTLKFMQIFRDVFGEYAGYAQMAIYGSQLMTHEHLNLPTDLRDEIMGKNSKKQKL